MHRIRNALAIGLVVVVVGACDPQPPTSPPSGGSSASPTGPGPSAASPTASSGVDPSDRPAVVEWTRVSTSADVPGPRAGHTWTSDPSDAAAYVFGGRDAAGALGDLWRYDLGADAWEPRDPAGPGPGPRSGHMAVWLDEAGVIVLGGEAGDGTVLGDAWAYDPRIDAWSELPVGAGGPDARTAACAAVGSDGRIWMTHGLGTGGTPLDDTWTLDPGDWSWARIDPPASGVTPAPRGGHGCWWTIDDRLVLHGGRAGDTAFGDTWSLDGSASASADPVWSAVETGGAAVARSDFGSVVASDRIVIVAGRAADGQPLDDVVAFDPTSLGPESFGAPGGSPDPRTGPAIVDDPAGERGLLFGGMVGDHPTDELWQFVLR